MFNTPQTVPKSHKVFLKRANLNWQGKHVIIAAAILGQNHWSCLEPQPEKWNGLQTATDLAIAELQSWNNTANMPSLQEERQE